MPYRQAITMIEDLPPMVQLAPTTPVPPRRLDGDMDNPSKYFDEAVKQHPTIQGKIRATESNPMAKYEEAMEQDYNEYKEREYREHMKSPAAAPPQEQPMYPDYPMIARPRSAVEQNYVSSNMIPRMEEQHLPISQHIPTRYGKPMGHIQSLNTYPIVEHLEQISCTDVAGHIKNCPVCKKLYFDRVLVIGIIAVLVIIILGLFFKLKSYSKD
jgi:hypothetical protein